jgi:hypothetical protein
MVDRALGRDRVAASDLMQSRIRLSGGDGDSAA